MKLYLFIRADLHVAKKPEWLDAFRGKYDEVFPYHISLKRAVEAPEGDKEQIIEKVTKIANNFKPFEVRFEEIFFGKTKFGHTVMVRADHSKELHDLRNQVFDEFKNYNIYFQPEHKAFDKDFNPHVTIARHLSDERLTKAKQEIYEPFEMIAKINSLKFALTEQPHDISHLPVFEDTILFSH
jgi:2'-5' RNA ligase